MCTSKAATQQVLDNYLSEKGYFRYGEFSKDVIAWASKSYSIYKCCQLWDRSVRSLSNMIIREYVNLRMAIDEGSPRFECTNSQLERYFAKNHCTRKQLKAIEDFAWEKYLLTHENAERIDSMERELA